MEMTTQRSLKGTELQERFARKYVELLGNGRAAAKAAGCECDSDESFDVSASVLLRNSKVISRIEQIRERSLKRTEVTAAKVLNELARVAFASMSDFAEWGPNGVTLKNSHDLTADDLAVVEEVSETTGKDSTNVRIKLASKLSALDKLAKFVGILPEQGITNVPPGYQCKRLTIMELQETENKVLKGEYIDEDAAGETEDGNEG